MIQGIEDTGCARMGPATASPSAMRYSLATLINCGFTFKKTGGGPGSSGAVSIDEQAAKPRQATAIMVTDQQDYIFFGVLHELQTNRTGARFPGRSSYSPPAAPSAILWT